MTNVQVTQDAVTVVASTDPVQVKAGGQAAVDAHNQDAAAHPDLVGSSTAQVEAIIKSGTAAVANNVLPPGLRIPEAFTITQAYVRLGTAPTGADLIVEFNRNGTLFATVTVPAGVTSGSTTGLTEAFVAGDVLTWDIVQVGSTTAGSDVAAAVYGNL